MAHQLPLVARLERIALDEAFREPDDAQLEAAAELDARAVAARHFHAAAADVDDDRDVARNPDAVDRGRMDEAGFLGSGNHLRSNAGLAGNRPEEVAAILGFTDIAAGAAYFARVLFFLFLVLFVVTIILGRRGPIDP